LQAGKAIKLYFLKKPLARSSAPPKYIYDVCMREFNPNGCAVNSAKVGSLPT
jgi:hypothetical protein